MTWDIAYGAKAALALQEYYNGYLSGKNSYTPGDADRDALIAAINGTVDVSKQQEAFKEFTKFENSARISSTSSFAYRSPPATGLKLVSPRGGSPRSATM